MQGEFQRQLATVRVEVQGGEVPHGGAAGAVADDELDVVVKRQADETAQRLAGKGDGEKTGAAGVDAVHAHIAPQQFVAYPLDAAYRSGNSHG
jgi:hypothetical protein